MGSAVLMLENLRLDLAKLRSSGFAATAELTQDLLQSLPVGQPLGDAPAVDEDQRRAVRQGHAGGIGQAVDEDPLAFAPTGYALTAAFARGKRSHPQRRSASGSAHALRPARAREDDSHEPVNVVRLVQFLGGKAAASVAAFVFWYPRDPTAAIDNAIALLIVLSAWGVLRDSTAILMEETPSGIDADTEAVHDHTEGDLTGEEDPVVPLGLERRQEMPRLNVDNPRYRLAMSAWRKLPLPITQLVGPMIARSIP